jgi:hypothetical protein
MPGTLGSGTLGSGTLGNPDAYVGPTLSKVAIGRSFPPDRLAIRIDAPNGFSARWAEDESFPHNVISNIEFEDEMPGGDKSLAGVLARNPQLRWRDDEAFADVKCYQPGVSPVFEGFLDKEPNVSGDQMSINPAMLGNQSVLEDDQGEGIGIINSDLGAWSGASPARRLLMALANTPIQQDAQAYYGQNYTSLRLEIQNGWEAPTRPDSEGWFDAGSGIKVARVLGGWRNGWNDAGFELLVGYSADESNMTEDSPDLYGAVEGSIDRSAANPRRYVRIKWIYNATPSGSEGGQFPVDLTNLRVIADHGLALQGTFPNVGFKMKQILEYIIPKYASPLEVRPEDIDDDGYILQHAWYERGPVADIVHDVLKYSLYDWFVRGKRFKVKKPGSYGRFWKAYVRESQLNEVGIDSQSLWDEIVVRFQDVSGKTLYVGPPGSGCDVEDVRLKLTDSDHPAVRAGRKRRSVLDMKGISNPAQAIEVGIRFLEESVLLNHAGSATLSGYVMDNHGVFWPAACVKSGDYISFVDAADPSYRKIVNRKYAHNSRGSEVDLDAPPSGMEALLERLQAALIPLGVS